MHLLLSFLVLSISGAITALWIWPLSAVSVYVIVRPLIQPLSNCHITLASGIPIATPVSIALISGVFFVFFKAGAGRLFSPIIIALMLFISSTIPSFLQSVALLSSIGGLLKLLAAASIFIVVYMSISSKSDAIKVFRAIMISSVLPILYGFYQFITATGHAWKGAFYAGRRVDSVLGEYNEYGIFLCFCILATLVLLMHAEKNRSKFIMIGMLCAQTLSLVLSLNRGSWIALAWGLSVSAVFHRRRINLKAFCAIGLLLAICFGSLMLSRFEELKKESPAGYSQNTLEERVRGWSDILSLIAKRPLIGYGLDTAEIVTKRKYQVGLVPHNDFLRLAFEAGVFAMLAYASFLVLLTLFLYAGTGRKQSTYVSFPAFAAICYFITISTVQNIVFSQVLFPLALTFFAAAKALGEIETAQTGLPLRAGAERKTAAERPPNWLPADA